MTIYKANVSLDKDVWKEAKRILKEDLNMTMSKYIEIQLRSLIRSQTQTHRQLMESVAEDLFYAQQKRKKKKKE